MARKGTKTDWQIVEFAYGFAVLYRGQRIALCADEDRAEAIVRSRATEKVSAA